ncbi:MAG: hypothetical protein ACI9HX_000255, partial [Pseudoalteromonas tetraodonis]
QNAGYPRFFASAQRINNKTIGRLFFYPLAASPKRLLLVE